MGIFCSVYCSSRRVLLELHSWSHICLFFFIFLVVWFKKEMVTYTYIHLHQTNNYFVNFYYPLLQSSGQGGFWLKDKTYHLPKLVQQRSKFMDNFLYALIHPSLHFIENLRQGVSIQSVKLENTGFYVGGNLLDKNEQKGRMGST